MDAFGIEGQVGTHRIDLQSCVRFEREIVDAGGSRERFAVTDVAGSEIDIVQMQAVGGEVDAFEVQAVEADVVPGQRSGLFFVLFQEWCQQGGEIGRTVVQLADVEGAVFQTDAADDGFLGGEQRRCLDLDQRLAQVRQRVIGTLDNVHVFEDQVVGEGEVDLAHLDLSVDVLVEDAGGLAHDGRLDSRDLDGDQCSRRKDQCYQDQEPDDFLPGFHKDIYPTNIGK